MVKVKEGIPTQTSVSKALGFNQCITLSLSPMNKPRVRLSTKVTSGSLMSTIIGADPQQLAKLEVITDVREAQVCAMKTISASSPENAGSENKERGGLGENGLQDEMSLRTRLRHEVRR